MHKHRLAKKIQKDCDHLKNALNCDSKIKSEKFLLGENYFVNKLTQTAHDIRCTEKEYQKRMEADFDVNMTKDDDEFYMDNCHDPYNAVILFQKIGKGSRDENLKDKKGPKERYLKWKLKMLNNWQ